MQTGLTKASRKPVRALMLAHGANVLAESD